MLVSERTKLVVSMVIEFEKRAKAEPDAQDRLEFEKMVDKLRSNIESDLQRIKSPEDREEMRASIEALRHSLENEKEEMSESERELQKRRTHTRFLVWKPKLARAVRLSELFDNNKDATQASLARYCQVTAPAVILWIKWGNFLYDKAVKIANYFGVNPDWLYFGKGDKFATPVVHEVPTATNPFAVLDVEIRRGNDWLKIKQPAPVAFNKDYLGSEAIFAETCRLIRAQGDRMAPTIKAGEFLLVNEAEKHVISGSIYAVSVNNEFLLCQISRITDGVRLHYTNANYPDEEFTNEMMSQVHIIGRVIMSVRQF